MKKILIPILPLLAVLSACDDIVTYDTDLPDRFSNDGPPEIEGVYDIADGEMAVPLEEGALAQYVHIRGRNLADPISVSFSGVEADLSACYIENCDSYVRIPRVMPGEVSNTLVYRTSKGTAEYPFALTIPEFSLTGLADEYAPAGSAVEVVGDYFDLFGFGVEGSPASISIEGQPVAIDSVSASYLRIVIPEGTPAGSLITFEWEDKTLGPQSKRIPYRNTQYLFFKNFDTAGFWSDALKEQHLTDGSADGDPESPGWRFLRFCGDIPANTWYSIGLGDGWYYDTPDDWRENWVLKFELWTNPAFPVPAYSSGGLFVQLNLKENVILDLGGVPLNTGGTWRTMRYPLGEMVSEMPKKGDYWGFAFTVSPPSDWSVDFAVADFRIEPANY